MRRHYDLRMLQQRAAFRRFLREHVQRHAAQPPRLQPGQQRRLVHQLAPRHVDNPRPRLDAVNLPPGDHIAGAVGERRMQGHEIGLGQQLIQRQQLHPDAPGVIRGHERIIPRQPHPEPLSAAGHFGAHPPQAADAQGFIAHFHAHKGAAPPLAAPQRLVGAGDVAGQGQHQRDGMLGGGHGVAGGRVHHRDPGPGGRLQINVVHPDSGAGDHLQPPPGGDHLPVDPRFAAHHQRIIPRHRRQQFGRRQPRLDLNLGPGRQQRYPLRADRIGN